MGVIWPCMHLRILSRRYDHLECSTALLPLKLAPELVRRLELALYLGMTANAPLHTYILQRLGGTRLVCGVACIWDNDELQRVAPGVLEVKRGAHLCVNDVTAHDVSYNNPAYWHKPRGY